MEQLAPLAPLPVPIGLNQRFFAQQSTTLVIKEKLFSWGGDYTVTDLNNAPWFKVHGKVLSLHQKKVISDLQGQDIFTVNTKLLALFKSFFVTSPQGDEIMHVAGNFSIGTPKSTITFINVTDGQPVKVKIAGNFFDTEAFIRVGDSVVARINRKLRNIIGPQKYTVTIAAGADVAMVLAICICLDERRRNDSNSVL